VVKEVLLGFQLVAVLLHRSGSPWAAKLESVLAVVKEAVLDFQLVVELLHRSDLTSEEMLAEASQLQEEE